MTLLLWNALESVHLLVLVYVGDVPVHVDLTISLIDQSDHVIKILIMWQAYKSFFIS